MENLFAKNTLVVNQKFTVLNNQYQVLDAEGKEIGFIQEKSSLGRTLLQFIVSKKMLPFELNILDFPTITLKPDSRVNLYFHGITLI